MKKNLVFMMTLCVVVFASHANAATNFEFPDGTKVSVDGKPTVVAEPNKANAPTVKKAPVKKKKFVKKTASAAKVAPAAVSPAASVSIEEAKKNLAELGDKNLEILPAPAKKNDISDPMAAFLSGTKTAKKKSAVSVKLNLKLLDVFMPDGVSATARRDWLQVSYTMRFPNGVDTSGQPVGFQTIVSDQGVIGNELSLGVKYKMVGMQYDPLPYVRTVGVKFYGSSLGKYEVTTLAKLVGKIYWWDGKNLSSSVGLGYEYTAVNGTLKMGGFPFKTSGDGWSPLVQFEGSYHFNRVWSASLGWEIGGPKLVTEIQGVPDIVTNMPYRGTLKLTANVFELFAIPLGK